MVLRAFGATPFLGRSEKGVAECKTGASGLSELIVMTIFSGRGAV
jgi:hypothetical protein